MVTNVQKTNVGRYFQMRNMSAYLAALVTNVHEQMWEDIAKYGTWAPISQVPLVLYDIL